jgi:plasmid rolling circle replication initiator protein Rep
MMQMARLIATESKPRCRKNFEITCYAQHFSVVFWSGARQNKIVIQVVAGEIHTNVTGESWRMFFEKVVKKSWNWFKNVVIHVVDKAADLLQAVHGQAAIAGAALLAIGW